MNQKSKDYAHFKNNYRPSYADYVYDKKYTNREIIEVETDLRHEKLPIGGG